MNGIDVTHSSNKTQNQFVWLLAPSFSMKNFK
jgi:hypothetical protein